MLETPDYPTLARVVRVRPRPDEKPAHGFTWGDYEDVRTGDDADAEGDGGRRSAAENEDGDDDEGWGVVTGRRSSEWPFLVLLRFCSGAREVCDVSNLDGILVLAHCLS
jgi:hypothetical protein